MAGAAEAVCGSWALACGTGGVTGGADAGTDDLHIILRAVVCIKDLGREAWWAVLDTAFLVQ